MFEGRSGDVAGPGVIIIVGSKALHYLSLTFISELRRPDTQHGKTDKAGQGWPFVFPVDSLVAVACHL